MHSAILALSNAIKNKQPAVMTTVVDTNDASPAKDGAQIILLEDGATAETLGSRKSEAMR